MGNVFSLSSCDSFFLVSEITCGEFCWMNAVEARAAQSVFVCATCPYIYAIERKVSVWYYKSGCGGMESSILGFVSSGFSLCPLTLSIDHVTSALDTSNVS